MNILEYRKNKMNTTITPEQRRTIEVARCMFCDRGFYLESNTEIERHLQIQLTKPFKPGFVYQSSNGFNIITNAGRFLSDLDFGEEYTHDYMHHVATCKDHLAKKLDFDNSLKIRPARDLNKRFDQGQIWVPTLQELEEFRNRFRDYLFNEGYGTNTKIYEELIKIGFRALN
jgi:hypothetical protein